MNSTLTYSSTIQKLNSSKAQAVPVPGDEGFQSSVSSENRSGEKGRLCSSILAAFPGCALSNVNQTNNYLNLVDDLQWARLFQMYTIQDWKGFSGIAAMFLVVGVLCSLCTDPQCLPPPHLHLLLWVGDKASVVRRSQMVQ